MNPQRRQFLKMVTSGTAASLSGAAQAGGPVPQANGTKPNFLVIMADQHRAGLTRGTGFALDTMPAFDRMAQGGVSFDRAYTTAPLCVPARVSLLTGRWP